MWIWSHLIEMMLIIDSSLPMKYSNNQTAQEGTSLMTKTNVDLVSFDRNDVDH